jgi:SAM-dependent methyltransferase
MRAAAAAKAKEIGATNLHLVDGLAESLPFPDQYFDVVCCFIAPHSTGEVCRVLKPGGTAILEKIAERDKINIKEMFGVDGDGPRGQFMHLDERRRTDQYRKEFGELFSSFDLRIGKWKTYLTCEGLIALCERTSTIRGFDRGRDAGVIDEIKRRYSTPKGIETTQQRLLIVAVK